VIPAAVDQPVVARLRALRVVPVIVIEDPAHAAPLAAALADGGLPCAEITFRTPRAVEALRRIASERPEFLVGAGTVLTRDQADRARDVGAQFAVAPGMNPRIVEHCERIGLPMYPGVSTPTDIETALGLGLRLVKFFPAEAMGGAPFLKAVAAPYAEMEFMPTGGITRDTLGAYLGTRRVVACGGSWIAPAEWIASGSFDRIRNEAAGVIELLGRLGRPAVRT
jgi:2-dehydro-3-deoxyphosphogluconate aldolase/(4S)-4-hydroxy-2-oxoglutarate aldolase